MILLRKQTIQDRPALIPTDQESYEKLSKIPDGKVVRTEAKRSRNPDHHRLFFALLNTVYENQDQFRSPEDLLEATKLEVGHSELRELFDGTRYRIGKSISFDQMGQDEFAQFYDKALDAWCQHFGWDREMLEAEVRAA